MKKPVRLFLEKATASLVLAIEHFNRPWDLGRVSAVLILLDHSFEMLLKAAILHKGGRIRERREKHNIGFDACVRRGFSDAAVKFLTEEDVLALQMLNSLRDAAQHDLVEVSEPQLYLHAQSALTLFRDLMKTVFKKELNVELPERVLPLSTTPPLDLAQLFAAEVAEIQKLLHPKHRRHTEAAARIKALSIVDRSVQGENLQPGAAELRSVMAEAKAGKAWTELFPGVAQLNLTASGTGPSLDLRIAKKEGIPTQIVPEGTPGAAVIAIRKVDELGFYNLGRNNLAEHVGLTPPKVTAIIRFLKLQEDPESFKRFVIQGVPHEQYSQKAIAKIKDALKTNPIEDIWKSYAPKRRSRSAKRST